MILNQGCEINDPTLRFHVAQRTLELTDCDLPFNETMVKPRPRNTERGLIPKIIYDGAARKVIDNHQPVRKVAKEYEMCHVIVILQPSFSTTDDIIARHSDIYKEFFTLRVHSAYVLVVNRDATIRKGRNCYKILSIYLFIGGYTGKIRTKKTIT
ncbi:unnamed protein product [Acanthoscelides obtectus]|uniref:Uncharacterized protein n=1 Tax=Acanthoscelides obtectus TaxID=200917 RepID=A0A9P0PJB6_ACAOB|nr:unnamed protein product [Acanthoscelides obtectus]CAK1668742.1 hypothetical protein AOBTE_LOCUS26575 [Acanthoscelides obtectus]